MLPDKRDLYRFPWSLNDNPIGWLEVTDVCNIHCRGCYRLNGYQGHKTLEAIQEEVLFLKRWRNCDNISIAGGEALIHPQLPEIVNFVHQQGLKSFILSNGQRLTVELLRELKRAGLTGIGFHVDMMQERPHWTGKNELELCELRERLADMVVEAGRLPCGFGITVYRENVPYIPDLLRWTLRNSHRVHGATFITYRSAIVDDPEYQIKYQVGEQAVALDDRILGYMSQDQQEEISIDSTDVLRIIQEHFPEYQASGYLGGTQDHTSIKWLAGVMIAAGDQPVGAIGRRTMEMAQSLHHLFHGTYFVYRRGTRLGHRALALGLLDPTVRRTWGRLLRRPWLLARPIRGVSIGIIQAPDIMPGGRVDMCDSCPDMTYYNGRLVNSCRLDEYRKFGSLVTPLVEAEAKAGKGAPR